MIMSQWKKLLSICMLSMMLNLSGGWTVLLYVDSTPDLSDMAIKAMFELMQEKIGGDVEFYVQVHAYGKTAFRCTVNSQGLEFENNVLLSGIAQEDLLSATEWAYSGKSIDKTVLILSNYGYGVLDPEFNIETEKWTLSPSYDVMTQNMPKRGFMFNSVSRSYLNYHDLSQVLSKVKTDVLNEKKVGVVMFDACMGGCIEIAYQLEGYAEYLIGAQVCSLKDGFDYKGLLHILKNTNTEREAGALQISCLDRYYKTNDRKGRYAYTALDLSKAQKVATKFMKLNEHILQKNLHRRRIKETLGSVFRPCGFDMYTDFMHFLESLEHVLCSYQECSTYIEKFSNLKKVLDEMVVNTCAGFKSKPFTNGCAIYFPSDKLHHSYLNVEFAQKTRWISLLESLLKR